ncbi:MAG: hydrogenase 4 subunit B, partial [Casimicrobiaceae bacterium]
AGMYERAALGFLAAACVLLGVFPVNVIRALDPVNAMLVGATAGHTAGANWLLLAPIASDHATYSPLIVLAVIVGVVLLTIQIVHRRYHGHMRRAPAWNCGSPAPTPRMQDTAEGFGQPIRQVFEPFFRMTRHLPTAFDVDPRYSVTIGDPFWHWIYAPVARATEFVTRIAGRVQQGRISVYLTYSFLTLLALLFFVG